LLHRLAICYPETAFAVFQAHENSGFSHFHGFGLTSWRSRQEYSPPQRRTIAFDAGSQKVARRPSLNLPSRVTHQLSRRIVSCWFASRSVPFQLRQGRPECRSAGNSDSGGGQARGGTSFGESRSGPALAKRQTFHTCAGTRERGPGAGRPIR